MNIVKSDSPIGQGNEKKHKVGIFEAKVVAVSPSQKELAKLFGMDVEKVKEPEYVKENGDGNTQVRITFWLQEVNSNDLYQVSYFLTDKESEDRQGNPQWVNQSGFATYGAKSDLPEWFTKFTNKEKTVSQERTFRKALVGESSLLAFVQAWLSKANLYDPETDILLDTAKLLRGNFKELAQLINTEYVGTVLAMATVRIADDGKTMQNVWKEVLPGWRIKGWDGTSKGNKSLDYFINNIKGEYGPKDAWSLELLHEYNGVTA